MRASEHLTRLNLRWCDSPYIYIIQTSRSVSSVKVKPVLSISSNLPWMGLIFVG